jgi:hypothetical protein
MAVALEMEFRGGTLDQYDQVMDKMGLRPGGVAPPEGLLFHWVRKTDDGIQVTDVWDNKDAFDAFAEAQIGPITQEVGIPGPPEVRFYDVYNHVAGA